MVVLSSTALYLLESRTWILSALASYGQLNQQLILMSRIVPHLKSSAIDPTDTAGPTFPVARLHVKIDLYWFSRGTWLRATRCAISRVAKVFSTQSGFARSPWRQWVTHLVGRKKYSRKMEPTDEAWEHRSKEVKPGKVQHHLPIFYTWIIHEHTWSIMNLLYSPMSLSENALAHATVTNLIRQWHTMTMNANTLSTLCRGH